MQKIIHRYLDRHFYIAEHNGHYRVFAKHFDHKIYKKVIFDELAIVFNLTIFQAVSIITFWSKYNLDEFFCEEVKEKPVGYNYAPYIPIQITPAMAEPYTENFTNYGARQGMAERYGARIVNPAYYGVLDVNV